MCEEPYRQPVRQHEQRTARGAVLHAGGHGRRPPRSTCATGDIANPDYGTLPPSRSRPERSFVPYDILRPTKAPTAMRRRTSRRWCSTTSTDPAITPSATSARRRLRFSADVSRLRSSGARDHRRDASRHHDVRRVPLHSGQVQREIRHLWSLQRTGALDAEPATRLPDVNGRT